MKGDSPGFYLVYKNIIVFTNTILQVQDLYIPSDSDFHIEKRNKLL